MQNTPNMCSVNYRGGFVFFSSRRAMRHPRTDSSVILLMSKAACSNAPPPMQSVAAFTYSRCVLGGPPCAKNFAMSAKPTLAPEDGKKKRDNHIHHCAACPTGSTYRGL